MPDRSQKWIVETDWLAQHQGSPDLIVLDGSMHLPTSGRNARAEYAAAHISGALFFDIEEIADRKASLPHMLPGTVQFASQVRKMGIGDGMRIVVYDTEGLYSAARVWWMFRAMGHDDVAVLNGGLKKWKAEGRPITDEPTQLRQPRHFTPRADASLVRDKADMLGLLGSTTVQIVDARAPGRFKGSEPEPRKGLRAGHIPGSVNVHYATLLNPNGTLKSVDELRRVFAAAGVDPAKPVVASCGSGVTAGVIAFALAQIGAPNAAVYDGSWTEWGHEDAGTPIEKG
jgi:thiosulfate/3-mercaptopyruvate sulfurtransferase